MASAEVIAFSTRVKSKSSAGDERRGDVDGRIDRIRGALTAGYRMADHVGARRTCAQMLDAMAALRGLAS